MSLNSSRQIPVRLIPAFLALLILFTLGCGLMGGVQPPSTPPTTVAQVESTPTLPPTTTPTKGQPTATAHAPTLRPSATPTLAPTVSPTVTPTVTATVDPNRPCDQAAFVEDVTVPDGTIIMPETEFTKTWRIKNTGSCTWTQDYAIVFDQGARMDGPEAQNLNFNVGPGETVDISIQLKAPIQSGYYKGSWKLRNAAGEVFGTGKNNAAFFVIIVASRPTDLRYDFMGFWCTAEWTVNGKPIPCNGKDGSPEGFVRIQVNPVLEGGYVDDEPAFITFPPQGKGSTISGKFSPFTVRRGDHFMTVIGCEYEYEQCNVTFQLDYQIFNTQTGEEEGPVLNFARWEQVYDGKFHVVDVGLDELVRKTVRFILTVVANDDTGENRAQWLKPRLDDVPEDAPTATPVVFPTITPNP